MKLSRTARQSMPATRRRWWRPNPGSSWTPARARSSAAEGPVTLIAAREAVWFQDPDIESEGLGPVPQPEFEEVRAARGRGQEEAVALLAGGFAAEHAVVEQVAALVQHDDVTAAAGAERRDPGSERSAPGRPRRPARRSPSCRANRHRRAKRSHARPRTPPRLHPSWRRRSTVATSRRSASMRAPRRRCSSWSGETGPRPRCGRPAASSRTVNCRLSGRA